MNLEWLRKLTLRKSVPRPARQDLMAAFLLKYTNFQRLLESNTELLKIISDIEDKLQGRRAVAMPALEAQTSRTVFHTARMIQALEQMSGRPQVALKQALEAIQQAARGQPTLPRRLPAGGDLVLPYERIGRDAADLVGGKNANLADVGNRLGLPVPRGFAITTAAFRRFIQANRLADRIQALKSKADLIETETLVEIGTEIQGLITGADVPEDLAHAVIAAFRDLAAGMPAGSPPLRLSMRSSAIGEDSALSFAGQYLTRLNVPEEGLLAEYKQILASLFSPRAIAYRIHMGVPFQEAAMAVACQEMIAARASGVMYTRSPIHPLENHVSISAVWGLGPYAVDGVVPPDAYLVAKTPALEVLQCRVAAKPARLVAAAGGYVAEEDVPADQREAPCLSPAEILRLADYGMRLEAHFQCPQDVEWALDTRGRLVVLQARPLCVDLPAAAVQRPPTDSLPGFEVLLEGADVACPGVGCGPAWHVRSESDLIAFPDGAVLVSMHSSPQFVMAMRKAQAIVVDSGNIAGHMASLAREYMVPTLMNTGRATTLISTGTEVTVDAYRGCVYRGRVQALLEAAVPPEAACTLDPAHQTLRRWADLIVPLNLVDPKSPRFTPANCRTVHDIMRYIHETSYTEVFQLGDMVTDHARLSVRLQAPIPIDLYVIDLQGGLAVDPTATDRVVPEEILSTPFAALVRGMLHDGLRGREPRPVHLEGFLSVMTRQMLDPPQAGGERFGDRSYAIISDKYMNFSSRVGYHYSILDTYCGKTTAKNYIHFQFKGGAADDVRRNRRARVIEKVLGAMGFLVDTLGDRVTARFAKQTAPAMEERLDRIGRLLIYTRQMDMLMHDEGQVEHLAACFLRGDYRLEVPPG